MARKHILPAGNRVELLCASYLKMVLVKAPMPASERLDALEKLDAMTRSVSRFDGRVLAAVPPLCDTAARMVEEALRLDPDEPRKIVLDDTVIESHLCPKSFDLLTGDRLFWTIVRINPGMLDAIAALSGAERS